MNMPNQLDSPVTIHLEEKQTLYTLPAFPSPLTSELIKMGPMTRQAIENGLLNYKKDQRLVLLVFRSKRNPEEIYYEMIPSSESMTTYFADDLNEKIKNKKIDLQTATELYNEYSKKNNVVFVISPDKKILTFEVTFTPTQRGTGVVHRDGVELMQQYYGSDVVPAVNADPNEPLKELGLLAGSVKIVGDRIELVTRSNFCN